MEQISLAERLTEAEEAAPASPEVALHSPADKAKKPGKSLVLSREATPSPALTLQSSGETLADDFHTYHVRDWGINE